MDSIFKESNALSEAGKELLAALSSRNCRSCQSLREFRREITELAFVTRNFKNIPLVYDCGIYPPVLSKSRTTLTRWIKDADMAQKALLENCDGCESLPAGAEKLTAERRQLVGSLLGGRTLINDAI
ncbi:MAG: hypothetical protein WCV72_03540 [Patescibacteria group bacterium]|jgi:hypothetical protein